MCGIQITKERIENKIKHRGIEYYSSFDNKWNTHFSSLPINSKHQGITQPMEVNNLEICFNGEIFNYDELGNYKSDLELILDVFNKNKWLDYYKKISAKFDGFWSITVKADGCVYFMTDPYGKKQLYYNKKGICSEIKPLIGEESLYSNVKFGTSCTNFEKTYRAMPGHIYKFDYSLDLPYKIDSIEIQDINVNSKTLIELIDESIVRRTKNLRMGKIALLFSGGLDSSILASRLIHLGIDFKAFSIFNNENKAVEDISKMLGFEVEWVGYDISKIEEAVYCYENSFDLGSLLPNYLLFKKCKEEGFEVVLTGDGADELFGGYKRNLESDTRKFDVLMELPYYHLVRIDRTSMANTVECRNPFLSKELYSFSKNLKWHDRKNKIELRKNFPEINNIIGENNKRPLRWKKSKEENKKHILEIFLKLFK